MCECVGLWVRGNVSVRVCVRARPCVCVGSQVGRGDNVETDEVVCDWDRAKLGFARGGSGKYRDENQLD